MGGTMARRRANEAKKKKIVPLEVEKTKEAVKVEEQKFKKKK